MTVYIVCLCEANYILRVLAVYESRDDAEEFLPDVSVWYGVRAEIVERELQRA